MDGAPQSPKEFVSEGREKARGESRPRSLTRKHKALDTPTGILDKMGMGIAAKEVTIASCTKARPLKMDHVFPPIWVPGYPGSGSELFRSLIQYSSGGRAGNIHSGNCISRTGGKTSITCKTHWPLFGTNPSTVEKQYQENFMLLVRNPSRAIPSYFSWIFEYQNHIKTHSMQAPVNEWRLWRDQNFVKEADNWKELILQWTLSDHYHAVKIIPYEDLVDEERGPVLFNDICDKLTTFGIRVTDKTNQNCIWTASVKGGKKGRKKHDYQPGFRETHKTLLLQHIDLILEKVTASDVLTEALKIYREDIEQNLPIDEVSGNDEEHEKLVAQYAKNKPTGGAAHHLRDSKFLNKRFSHVRDQ